METQGVLTKQVIIEERYLSPRVYYVRNLLSHAECDDIIGYASPKMQKSTTVDPDTGEYKVVGARSSDGMCMTIGETEAIANVEQRIVEITQYPLMHGEAIQVIHYNVGQEYVPHFDFFDPVQKGSQIVLKTGGQRVISVIMYLNDVEEGGETFFPEINLRIQPAKGDAVLFFSLKPDGSLDRSSLHGGLPVIRGEKWIATKWIRERPYDDVRDYY